MRMNFLPRLSATQLGRPRYRARNPILEGKLYQYRQPLYDFYGVTVATAVTEQTLFQVQKGGSYTPAGAAAAFTKTFAHTNMTAAGQLPSPQKFFTKAIALALRSDVLLSDAQRFLWDTILLLQISNRDYAQAHAFKFPAAGGPFSGSSGVISNGLPTAQASAQFTLWGDLGEVIEQLQPIAVTLNPIRMIDAGGATVLTTATLALGGTGINALVYLDGLLNREVS